MPSIAPSLAPKRTSGRIYARFGIDGIIFVNYHSRPLYYDRWPLYHHFWPLNNDWRPLDDDRLPLNDDRRRSANHDSFGNYGCPFLDNNARSRPLLIGLNFPRPNFLSANFPRVNLPCVAGNFGITSDRQIGGHCR
jgi:hypothetical protein